MRNTQGRVLLVGSRKGKEEGSLEHHSKLYKGFADKELGGHMRTEECSGS